MQGIYSVKVGTTQFIGFSKLLSGTLKRLKFELALNASPYANIQRKYNECPDAAVFEVLEEYIPAPEYSDEEATAHLMAKLYSWKQKLDGDVQIIQNVN